MRIFLTIIYSHHADIARHLFFSSNTASIFDRTSSVPVLAFSSIIQRKILRYGWSHGETKDPTNSDVRSMSAAIEQRGLFAPGDRLYASSLLDRAWIGTSAAMSSCRALQQPAAHQHACIHDKCN